MTHADFDIAAFAEALMRPSREKIAARTKEEVASAMDNLRDDVECISRSIDARLYWFGIMEACRREYVKASPSEPTPLADYLPGGEVNARHAAEPNTPEQAAVIDAMEQNRGFDAEHLDVQPEDEP